MFVIKIIANQWLSNLTQLKLSEQIIKINPKIGKEGAAQQKTSNQHQNNHKIKLQQKTIRDVAKGEKIKEAKLELNCYKRTKNKFILKTYLNNQVRHQKH